MSASEAAARRRARILAQSKERMALLHGHIDAIPDSTPVSQSDATPPTATPPTDPAAAPAVAQQLSSTESAVAEPATFTSQHDNGVTATTLQASSSILSALQPAALTNNTLSLPLHSLFLPGTVSSIATWLSVLLGLLAGSNALPASWFASGSISGMSVFALVQLLLRTTCLLLITSRATTSSKPPTARSASIASTEPTDSTMLDNADASSAGAEVDHLLQQVLQRIPTAGNSRVLATVTQLTAVVDDWLVVLFTAVVTQSVVQLCGLDRNPSVHISHR